MDTQKTEKDYEEEMNTIIFQNVLLRVVDDLTEEKKEHLNKLLQASDSEMEVVRMLQSEVPNLQDIVKEETERLEKEVQELMDGIKVADDDEDE